MKKLTQLLLVSLVITGALFTSCVKDEALNVEADILSATFEGAKSMLLVDPIIKNDFVQFRLIDEPTASPDDEMVSYLFAPTFQLSPGATIEPASGTELDFATPQTYVVTSEDGLNEKTYTISFSVEEGVLLNYSFETAEVYEAENPTGYYHIFYEVLADGSKKWDWASGNEGYNFLAETLLEEGEELEPSIYPTAQVNDGYEGKGIKMQTKATGPLGAVFGSPLAAGSFFLGDFDLKITSPIKSTLFGQPYTYDIAPAAVKGYFKYKAGEDFVVNKEPSELEEDIWDAYAILFEQSAENNFLLGDHNFKDNRIVSVARLDNEQAVETDEWTEFEIKFENVGGKSFNPNADYMFTIVFSSSKEGAIFNGAVGSQLYIDEVEIILAD